MTGTRALVGFEPAVVGDLQCFTFFSTVYQLYKDDGMVIVIDCKQWNPFYGCQQLRLQRVSNPGLLDQQNST